MDKVLYFAYGANRDIKMMQAITGSSELKGKPATLKGYSLYVQRLDQVPDTVSENSPAPISPRDLLKESWPDTFTSYIIKEDPEGEVAGVVWELTPLQRELVRDWELVDFGWYGYNSRCSRNGACAFSNRYIGRFGIFSISRCFKNIIYRAYGILFNSTVVMVNCDFG